MNVHITTAIAQAIGVTNFMNSATKKDFSAKPVTGIFRDDYGTPHRVTVVARVSPRNQQPERLLVSSEKHGCCFLVRYLESYFRQSHRHLDRLPDIDHVWPPYREPTHAQ